MTTTHDSISDFDKLDFGVGHKTTGILPDVQQEMNKMASQKAKLDPWGAVDNKDKKPDDVVQQLKSKIESMESKISSFGDHLQSLEMGHKASPKTSEPINSDPLPINVLSPQELENIFTEINKAVAASDLAFNRAVRQTHTPRRRAPSDHWDRQATESPARNTDSDQIDTQDFFAEKDINMTNGRSGWVLDGTGVKKHFRDGKLHGIDGGPAEIRPNGTQGYYKEGNLHRESGPAFETVSGTLKYAIDGRYHRLGGLPAIIWSRSPYREEYWEYGQIKRAIKRDGTLEWYAPNCTEKESARLHREDGPAVIYTNGNCEYWLNGLQFATRHNWEIALNQMFKDRLANERIATATINDENIDAEINSHQEKKVQGKMKEKQSLTDMLKSNAVTAGYRVGATQATNLVKTAIVNLMRGKGADNATLQGITTFLDSELGAAFISLAIGTGIHYVPGIGEDPRVQRLGEEMRVNSMAAVGNLVVGEGMNLLLPALSQIVQSLPAVEETATVRLEETKSKGSLAESIQSEQAEEESDDVKTMNA